MTPNSISLKFHHYKMIFITSMSIIHEMKQPLFCQTGVLKLCGKKRIRPEAPVLHGPWPEAWHGELWRVCSSKGMYAAIREAIFLWEKMESTVIASHTFKGVGPYWQMKQQQQQQQQLLLQMYKFAMTPTCQGIEHGRLSKAMSSRKWYQT